MLPRSCKGEQAPSGVNVGRNGHHFDCGVLASQSGKRRAAERPVPETLYGSRRVAQEDIPGHAEEKHALHHDGRQRPGWVSPGTTTKTWP